MWLNNDNSSILKVAGEITARQDESDVGRKALIDGMKEFKKDNEDEVRTAVAPLIRSFQNEVDALSRLVGLISKVCISDVQTALPKM